MLEDIRALLATNPFLPFVLTVTGLDAEYPVDDPRQVTLPAHGETIHYRTGSPETVYILAVRHIVAVTVRRGWRP